MYERVSFSLLYDTCSVLCDISPVLCYMILVLCYVIRLVFVGRISCVLCRVLTFTIIPCSKRIYTYNRGFSAENEPKCGHVSQRTRLYNEKVCSIMLVMRILCLLCRSLKRYAIYSPRKAMLFMLPRWNYANFYSSIDLIDRIPHIS